MEDWLGLTFRPLLAKYVENYSKQQLQLNFLKGKGVMREVVLNVTEVNALPAVQASPFRVAHAAMDHVAFKASLTRLRTKPVSVQIGRLDIDLFERPPHEAPPAAAAAAASLGHQSQEAEPAPSTAAPSPPPPRAYKLTDRITDGVRVEVGEVRVRLRTLGRRKCPRPGPWSPPDGLWVLRRVLLSTVDEDGLEVADLEKGWAHNKTRLKERRRRRLLARKGPAADGQPEEEEGEDDYLLFKRLLVGSLALYVLPRHQPSSSHRNSQAGGESGGKVDDDGSGGPRLLVPETPVECRFAVRRPLHDVARWLGFEMDLQVDRFRLHLPQGCPLQQGGREEEQQEEERAYSQWVAFFLGFISCLAERHPWATPRTNGSYGGGDDGEAVDLLLLDGMRRDSSNAGVVEAGQEPRPMIAMYRAGLDGRLPSASSSVGPDTEEEGEDDDDDEDGGEDEERMADGGGTTQGPPDFLTDNGDDASFLLFSRGAATINASSSFFSAGPDAAVPQPAATAPVPPPSASNKMRLVLALTLPFVEIALIDCSAGGGGHTQRQGADQEEEKAVHGWALLMHNVRVESIRGGRRPMTITPASTSSTPDPSENVLQARFGHFELRALGRDGGPPPGRPALLRPMLQGPSSPAAPDREARFPTLLPRGVRDDCNGGGWDADLGTGGGGATEEEEAATAADGASLLLRHHLHTDALVLKLHTLAYPPPPPPQVAGNLEARFARRLHLVADLPAWRRLAAFLATHTDGRCLSGHWPGTIAEGYPLQRMPGGGVRNVAWRAAGLVVRLPCPYAVAVGGGFTLGCGAASLMVSPALTRFFLEGQDGGVAALDGRLLSTAAGTAAAAAATSQGGAGESGQGTTTRSLVPWRMQLTLDALRLVESVTATAATDADAPCGDEGPGLRPLLGPVPVHLLLSIDDGTGLGLSAAARRSVDERTAFYVPLDAASSLSVSLACLGPLHARLQPQAWLALADMLQTLKSHHPTIYTTTSSSTPPPPSSPWPPGALSCAVRLPELQLDIPPPPSTSTSDSHPPLGRLAARNVQCIVAASSSSVSALAWMVEGLEAEACGHGVMEITGANDEEAAVIGTLQRQGPSGNIVLDVCFPTVRLRLPLAEHDLERAVAAWIAALCAPTGLLSHNGGCSSLPFPSGSVGTVLLRWLTTARFKMPPAQQQQQQQPTSCSLRLRIQQASASALLEGQRSLQADAGGILLEAQSPDEAAVCCTWSGEAATVGLALVDGAGRVVSVLSDTSVLFKATSPPPLLLPSSAWTAGTGVPSSWGAELVVCGTGVGLRASLSSELAEAVGAVQQQLGSVRQRLSFPDLATSASILQQQQPQPQQDAQAVVHTRFSSAIGQAHASLAAARQAVRVALAAHDESQQRTQAREAAMAGAVAAKELQRRQLAALHHADHAGWWHVGTLASSSSSSSTTMATGGGQAAAAVKTNAKAKALLALPRRWCLLRGDLLLVYDQPHSFNLERALPLRHGGTLHEASLADAPSSRHHRRMYALVCTRGDSSAAGLPVFLACETGPEATAWAAALRSFLEAQPEQQHPTSTPPPNNRRFPLLLSPRSSSSIGGAGSNNGPATAPSATPTTSSASHGGRPPSGSRRTPSSVPFKPPSVFARRAKTPLVTTSDEPAFSAAVPAPLSASSGGPASSIAAELPSFLSIRAEPTSSSGGTSAASSYRITADRTSSGRDGGLQQLVDAPSVTRRWEEIKVFHHDFLPRWLQATTAAASGVGQQQQHQQQGMGHAPTGMGPDEAMAYADKLLRGSGALLQRPAPSEPERWEQARVLTMYLRLLLAACPLQGSAEMDGAGRACRAALQRFLGLTLPILAVPLTTDAEEEDEQGGAAPSAPASDPVASALRAADTRLRRAEAAVLRLQLTGALHAAVVGERERAAAAEREVLARRVQELKAALAAEQARAATLEGEVGRAVLAREDAVQAMTEVSADAARKLMLGELRYLQLLKRAHPRAYAAEQDGGHGSTSSRRHSHHHATRPAGPSPFPPPQLTPTKPSSLSASLRASPTPPMFTAESRSHSSIVVVGSTPRQHVRRLSSSGFPFDISRSGSGGGGPVAHTTAQQRREQLDSLLLRQQSTPPPRSPGGNRSLTPPSLPLVGEGVVTRAHHTEVVYRLKALLAAKEEEARGLKEALGLAQEEAEGRASQMQLWRLLAMDVNGEEGDDGLFENWRARVAAERAERAEVEGRLVVARAQWLGLVEGLSLDQKQTEEAEGGKEESGIEWEGVWRERRELLALARGQME